MKVEYLTWDDLSLEEMVFFIRRVIWRLNQAE